MKKNKLTISENELIKYLQPIRGFVLAQVLYYFMDSDLYSTVAQSGGISVKDLAKKLKLHQYRLEGVILYLSNEGFLSLDNDLRIHLTESGKQVINFYPWYKLLVGGYSLTFQQISQTLNAGAPYAPRDGVNVGIGSCGISQFDALPMTRRLLNKIAGKWQTIVDLGCGDASYLIDLCQSIPNVSGIGIEANSESVDLARRKVEVLNLEEKITIFNGSNITFPELPNKPSSLCFLTAFVLQEILEQSGRQSIVEMLASIREKYPASHVIVIEVDHQPNNENIMSAEGLGLAYYNPYYLIHRLTKQKLENASFWVDLFYDAGLEIIATEKPDPTYDSLGLKIGFLLSTD